MMACRGPGYCRFYQGTISKWVNGLTPHDQGFATRHRSFIIPCGVGGICRYFAQSVRRRNMESLTVVTMRPTTHAGTPMYAHVEMQQNFPCAPLFFTDTNDWAIAIINIRWVGIVGLEVKFQASGPSRLSCRRLLAANQPLLRSDFNHLAFQPVKSAAANRNHHTKQ